MKITKRQLRRIIKEAMTASGVPDIVGGLSGVPGGNIQNLVDQYKEWAIDHMGTPSGPNSSSVLATFLVDRGLDQGPMADNIMKDMAREMRFDIVDVRKEVKVSREEYDAGGVLSDEEIHQRGFMEAKITDKQLRKIIREQLLLEQKEMQDIITNPYEEVEDYNILANYALDNDIQGALADPALKPYIEKNEMGWVADEAVGWFKQVGEATDLPAPEGWDSKKAYKFLRDLEDAAWKVYNKKMQAAIKNDPDKEFLEFLGNQWTSQIEPNDLPDIKWKEYKKYVRLKPPRSISHGAGEINISKEDINALYSGAYQDFIDFLTTRTGGDAGRRKPYKKSPPPYYD